MWKKLYNIWSKTQAMVRDWNVLLKILHCIWMYPTTMRAFKDQLNMPKIKQKESSLLFWVVQKTKNTAIEHLKFLIKRRQALSIFEPAVEIKRGLEASHKIFEREPTIFSNLGEALERIIQLMAEDDTLLITGSFFLISDYKPSFWQINRL